MARTIGCYVHIPFCVKKCAYCDFNSYSGYGESLMRRYVSALISEIERSEPPESGEVVDTIFFGGGTPTAIPAEDEASILAAVLTHFPMAANAEITTEANPGTADIAGLSTLRAAGFNRISFGVQSFDAGLLKAIDRLHSADEAKLAVGAARSAAFENVSIDLMFGLPGQRMAQWQDTIDRALDLETDHISMYSLIVEEGTGFGTMARKGLLVLPDDDLVADMYSVAIERASAAGFEQYEISNFARPGCECMHNLHYWRGDDYYGFGAGAVSSRHGLRAMNALTPARYTDAVRSETTLRESEEVLSASDLLGEAMMLGLRLTREGVDVKRFRDRFRDTPLGLWRDAIGRYTDLGLLESDDQDRRLRLTARGVFLANEVMAAFL